jgi:uncharacterized phage protein gp47/JayE
MPVLDTRDEIRLAAEAISRVSGVLTAERILKNIEVQRELLAMVESGAVSPAICPELTNVNPSSEHTALLEAMAWLIGFLMYKINQVPEQNEIAFARLFRIELREATRATTTLQFTINPPPGVAVTIPAGTAVSTVDEGIIFETDEDLLLAAGVTVGTVAATRTVVGVTLLAPGKLTTLLDSPAWVEGVTNPDEIESGSEAESVEAALERARNYQRRAERLVSARDIEDAIYEDVLARNGIVKAWPFVMDGDFETPRAGHTTVVVMTRAGGVVSGEIKRAISAQLQQAVGSQFIYVKDPQFVDFNVEANVRVAAFVSQSGVVAEVERRLRAFYAIKPGNFGRTILRSEIIAEIEGTSGVDRIEPEGVNILIEPLADIDIAPYELPRLISVNLHVV